MNIRITDTYSPGASFWEVHPQYTIVNPFKDMYDRDESNDKEESSTLMWFIVFCYSPDSKFRNDPDKHKIIGEDFCGNVSFYEDFVGLIEPAKDKFLDMELHDRPAKKSIIEFEDKLKERDIFIRKTPFRMDEYDEETGKMRKGTVDQLDAMMARTSKLWDDYKRLKEDLDKEENGDAGEAKGGSMPSLADEGDI